jgi:AcrR family transcriptional regulator
MNEAHATLTPRQTRREATSERILDAAERLLESEGPDALTMQRLAAEIGYTVGAAYRYFASKDAIVAALQRRVFDGLSRDLAAALERFEAERPRAGKLTALTRVAIVARVYATLGSRRPTHARLVARMLAEPENLLDDAHGGANTLVALELGAQAVRELAGARESEALEPGDDLERALVLWSGLSGVMQGKKLERWGVPGLETERLADAMVRTLLVGWGAEPARAREALGRAATFVTV